MFDVKESKPKYMTITYQTETIHGSQWLYSNTQMIQTGVPQGSILLLLLYCISMIFLHLVIILR